jgi:four helix bundle protein
MNYLMSFKFEKLVIWQLAMDYAENIHALARKFPTDETFNLTSQIKRAADSIALNIAEGSIGQSNLEQKKFVGYSIRSLAEVITCLYKALRRNYITQKEFDKNYMDGFEPMNKMAAFRNNIR